jgi:hypothetical protein
MLYVHLPIVDVFRRLDAHTLWIPGAITTVHDEPTYRKLAAAAKIRLTDKKWIADRGRSAALVLGSHPISVRKIGVPA